MHRYRAIGWAVSKTGRLYRFGEGSIFETMEEAKKYIDSLDLANGVVNGEYSFIMDTKTGEEISYPLI